MTVEYVAPTTCFVRLPNELARDKRLSDKAFRVLVIALSGKQSWNWSAAKLADAIGCDRKATLRALHLLADLGYAEKSYRMGARNRVDTWDFFYPAREVPESQKGTPEDDVRESQKGTPEDDVRESQKGTPPGTKRGLPRESQKGTPEVDKRGLLHKTIPTPLPEKTIEDSKDESPTPGATPEPVEQPKEIGAGEESALRTRIAEKAKSLKPPKPSAKAKPKSVDADAENAALEEAFRKADAGEPLTHDDLAEIGWADYASRFKGGVPPLVKARLRPIFAEVVRENNVTTVDEICDGVENLMTAEDCTAPGAVRKFMPTGIANARRPKQTSKPKTSPTSLDGFQARVANSDDAWTFKKKAVSA